jgi:RecB family endonuclease NucS
MNAKKLNEKELSKYFFDEERFSQLGLKLLDKEVKIGAFKLDGVAIDTSTKELVVIELKVNASKNTLAQLLIYPYVLHKALCKLKFEPPPIRSLLVTTHVDLNVVELAQNLANQRIIKILVCTDSGEGMFSLVSPDKAPKNQAWDQSEEGSSRLKLICDELTSISSHE